MHFPSIGYKTPLNFESELCISVQLYTTPVTSHQAPNSHTNFKYIQIISQQEVKRENSRVKLILLTIYPTGSSYVHGCTHDPVGIMMKLPNDRPAPTPIEVN